MSLVDEIPAHYLKNPGGFGLKHVYHEIDLPYVQSIIEMEQRGLLLDVDHLRELSKIVNRELDEIKEAIFEIAGREFNLNSCQPRGGQCAWYVYDHLGLPEPRDGTRSTDKEHLEPLLEEHGGVMLLYMYRRTEKLRGTYIDALPKFVNPKTGRLHTHFLNTRVRTGRVASKDPFNAQNVPKRATPDTPEFLIPIIKEIRKAIIAPPGHVIYKFDQSQVEFRIMVVMGNDLPTIEAIKAGRDVHSDSGATYLGIPYEEFVVRRKSGDKEMEQVRSTIKQVVYGQAYGQTEDGLQVYLNSNGMRVTREQAGQLRDAILDTKPGIKRYIAMTKEEALARGYVETYYGRIIPHPELLEDDTPPWLVARNLRQAVNGKIQGTSADFMKVIQNRVRERRRAERMRSVQILAVHDESAFECPEDEVERLDEMCHEYGTSLVDWPIELTIESGHAKNWGDCG